MNILSRIIAIAVTVTSITVYPALIQNHSLTATGVKSVKQQNRILEIAIPFKARIIFKDTTSTLGKIINIDTASKQITLNNKNYAIAEIDKITFPQQNEFTLLHSGNIYIRGSQATPQSNRNMKIWTEPLTNTRMIDADNGFAEINLTSLSNSEWRGIEVVKENSTYVVDEIVFDESASTVTITAIPYAE